jgi:hypothetical protein
MRPPDTPEPSAFHHPVALATGIPFVLPDHAVRAIMALHDLPHLVAALGHEPLWEPFDPRSLGLARGCDLFSEAAIVGRLGGFTWYAVTSSDPARDAPRLARRLTERGRVCGVLGLDPTARQLAVSVAFGGAPVLEVDLARPSQLATSCLARIGSAEHGGPLAFAARTAEALSGEGLGRQFFAAFRATRDRFTSAMASTIPERERHELALLHLTRVLFLYFVQAKGWLDGSDHFLRTHVDDCLFRRGHLHRDLLLPLFFGTLNTPMAGRGRRALGFGRVPFLNGGLFEPHPLEHRHRATIHDAAWRDAFDTLFERYHFTAASDAAGAIAPEMLGRVFEGVMEPGVRKSSGTYYTPPALVRSLVDAALAGYVGGRLGVTDAEAAARLEAGEGIAVCHLEDITILDPAVGSGAFLLGALDRLAALGGAPLDATVRRRILSRNLYGVDLNPTAVRLAELRLWLAVIGTEPDGSPERVDPLPNLDAFVRQGDSLEDPLRFMLSHPVRAPKLGSALAAARRAAAVSTGAAKRDAIRLLRRLEVEAATERFGAAIEEAERLIRGMIAAGREPSLFGERGELCGGARKALYKARAELRALRSARRQLARDRAVPTFDFDTHFGDVMSRGGFGLVVGNPPWVRAEAIPAGRREWLRQRFRWWRSGSGRGYRHQPDLSVAFLERGWELTAPDGVLAMLVPSKVATAAYGATARAAFAELGTVLAVEDLSERREARFDATTYPLAVVVRKRPCPSTHQPRLGLQVLDQATTGPPELPGAPWVLARGGLHRTLSALRGFPPLLNILRVQLGVKTGANHLFLSPPDEIEPELLRPAVRGRDVRPFVATPIGRIIWTHDPAGRVLAALPAAATRHFSRHFDALRRRADDAADAPWALFRASAGRELPRVVWPDMAPRLEAAGLVGPAERRFVPLNTCYVVICREPQAALALTAWLNSTWIRATARVTADQASGGYARFNARAVGAVPLPAGVLDDPRLATLATRGVAGEDVQEELDAVAADWLALSPPDRLVLSTVVGVGSPRRR